MPPAMNSAFKAALLLAALALGGCGPASPERAQGEAGGSCDAPAAVQPSGLARHLENLLASLGLGEPDNTRVKLSTSLGDLTLRLEDQKAPITVANFLAYVDSDGYQDTLFHRVIPGFMIQGGGLNKALNPVPVRKPIRNEADRGLRNCRGTIAMARTSFMDSATRQFFINVADNPHLDHSERSCTREQVKKNAQNCASFGYAVFGMVESGMEVVERIAMQQTGARGPHPNVPVDDVLILGIERLDR